MDAFKISIKLFVENDSFAPAEFVPIFHGWIQRQALDEHLLIDVADYAHVPSGPGSLLVASEANIQMDRGGNRLGLLYLRKQPQPGSFADRLRGTLVAALKAAELEQEPGLTGRLKFRTDEVVVRIHDRLLAPNTPETFAEVRPDVEATAKELYAGAPFRLEHTPSSQELFEVRIKGEQSPSVATLRERLGVATPAAGAR